MTKLSKKCVNYLFAFVATFALVLALAFSGASTAHASGENIFPNGGFEDEGLGWYGNGGSVVVSSDAAHTGEKSLFVAGHWVRTDIRGDDDNPNAIFTEIVSGVELGTIYNVSMWTKNVNEGTTTLGASMILTAQAGEGWTYPYINFFNGGNMYFYTYDAEWKQHTSTFGLARGADGNIVLLIDGVKQNLGVSAIGNINLDLGANNGGAYFDDIAIVKTNYTTNVAITLKDGADVVTGKTLIIKDADGVVLENQPEIVEDNGVYTVKGLTFDTLNDTYRYAVEGVNGLADGVINALDKSYELGISAYSASVSVKDEDGAAIADATVTATVAGANMAVVNNGDGTYSINDLYNAVDVKVEKEGLIPKSFTLSADAASVEVVLKAVKPATEVAGNLVANGNFEGVLASGSQEPGKWNPEAGTLALTTNVQQDGVYGLVTTGRIAYRIDLGGLKFDGTKYVFAFAVTGTGTMTLDIRPTVTADGGWAYPQTNLVAGHALTNEFEVVKVEFAITFDEIEQSFVYHVNGVEVPVSNKVTSIAAIDFVFTASEGAVLDNVSCLEAYDIEFTVVEGGVQVTEGLEFVITDGAGNALDLTPVYADEKWTIAGACGVVSVTVINGEVSYPTVVFDSRNTTATIENGFDLTVTLKDEKGNLVAGAVIVARKGATDLFTMVDNGDGTYSYSGALGSFNLYVTLEGYDFPVERNVTFENANITITANSSPAQEPESSEAPESTDKPESTEKESESKSSGGCLGSITGSIGMTVVALLGAFGVVVFKKKEN